MLKEGQKRSPANHIAWINLVYGNTKHCVNFGHSKAHNRFTHSQLNSDSILSLKNEENLTILLTVLSYLKTHRILGQ